MSLRLKGINKSLGDFKLRNIDLEVERGEFFVILGPSGAGKTLILEMVAGLSAPDSGEISGVDRRKIGFIYQDYMLFPHLDVFKNIGYGLKVRKWPGDRVKARVETLAEQLEIRHLLSRKTMNLSGGEKQRVAIARAMAISPELYLIDEPTSALDSNLRSRTRQMFIDLHKRTSSTFIHVTHDFEEALTLGDRIAVLIDGRVVQCGRPDDVFNHPRTPEVADFLGYRNVFGGAVRDNRIDLDGIRVTVPLEKADMAYIAVRSDDIIVSRTRFRSSARNSFYGKVVDILKRASVVEVILDIGITLTVDITRKSYEEMKIKIGDGLWATFKVSSLKVFEH